MTTLAARLKRAQGSEGRLLASPDAVPGAERVVTEHDHPPVDGELCVMAHRGPAGRPQRVRSVVVADDQMFLAVEALEDRVDPLAGRAQREIAERNFAIMRAWNIVNELMQALELANRVGDALGTTLDLADLFFADDFREWADSVEAHLADPDGHDDRVPLPPLRTIPFMDPL